MSRRLIALNTTLACLIAVAAQPARAETAAPALMLAAGSSATVVTASGSWSATVAGLNPISLQALPGFPIAAYREGYQHGRVLLDYTVQPDGSVRDVRVIDADPVQAFSRAALTLVAGLRFVPTPAPQARRVEVAFTAQ